MQLPVDFNEKFNQLIADVNGIKQSVTDTNGALKVMMEGMNKLVEENEELKKKVTELEGENENTRRRLEEAEQYSRINNVIITGIPQEPDEDLKEKITELAEKLGVKLYEYDICATHRLSKKGEAPAIVVKMNNREKKMKMIKEGRKRKIQASDIGYATKEHAIFINEHLTNETAELLRATKEELKVPGLMKFVWPSEGHVLTRETESSRTMRIRDWDHLQAIVEEMRGKATQNGEKKTEEKPVRNWKIAPTTMNKLNSFRRVVPDRAVKTKSTSAGSSSNRNSSR